MLNPNILKRSANFHRPLLFHGGLWILSFIILLFVFSKGQVPLVIDYIYSLAFLIVLAIPALINFYVLIPLYLKRERYLLYILGFIINLVLFTFLSIIFFQKIIDTIFPNYFFISYLKTSNTILIFSIFLISSTLLKLAEDWFYYNTNENKILRYKNELVETQLSSLKAQINPHFLFNSLNVIYALALDKKDEIKTAIVQLSDILRYVIYDTDTDRVTLKDEITLLKNYIAFQGYRVDLSDAVQLSIDVSDENYKIYPMLLLPLLENSFKYGLSGSEYNQPITIYLAQNKSEFKFEISNSNSYQKNTINESYSGVGLSNLKNNLTLVYPNQHELLIEDEKSNFKVTLRIFNINDKT